MQNTPQQQVICTRCGNQMLGDTQFCPKCGTPITYPNVPAPPPITSQPYYQNNMYHTAPPVNKIKNPKTAGMLVWSIINTIFFFMFITPIFAIVQSVKARNAPNPESVKKHKKIARILNLSTYIICLLLLLFGAFMSYFRQTQSSQNITNGNTINDSSLPVSIPSASENQTEIVPNPPLSDRVNPGEILFTGRLGHYSDDGYYYESDQVRRVDVLDISYRELIVSFVLSADKKEIRDVKIEIEGLNFIVGRDGQGVSVEMNSVTISSIMTYDIAPGVTRIVLNSFPNGIESLLTLEFDGDIAFGELNYIYDYRWNNDKIPIDLGTRSITFTSETID